MMLIETLHWRCLKRVRKNHHMVLPRLCLFPPRPHENKRRPCFKKQDLELQRLLILTATLSTQSSVLECLLCLLLPHLSMRTLTLLLNKISQERKTVWKLSHHCTDSRRNNSIHLRRILPRQPPHLKLPPLHIGLLFSLFPWRATATSSPPLEALLPQPISSTRPRPQQQQQ